jgi:hypothetical protein
MARSYAMVGNATNTASATLPLATLISTTSIRPKLFAFDIGSDATPADHACKYAFQRCTTTGTAGSSVTPQAIDPADPASGTTAGLAVFSVGPTLTANAFLWQTAINQRASYHYQAAPSKEFVMPAVASNGLALMSLVVDSAFNAVFVFHFEE